MISDTSSPNKFSESYFSYLKTLIDQLSKENISEFIKLILKVFRRIKCLKVCIFLKYLRKCKVKLCFGRDFTSFFVVQNWHLLSTVWRCARKVQSTYTYQIQGKTYLLFNYADRFLLLKFWKELKRPLKINLSPRPRVKVIMLYS